ncbi:MAG: sugar phosphate isomerase/epimerase [Chloroflexi bacterium]|nr:MAG: sugar phosphate isomerase/epimerase [Chloroflexota bacterium]
MLHTGLVSVTFRKLTVPAILALVKQAGLEGIEWGGDIHVPPGDLVNAKSVRQQTLEAGLQVAAYGSYYRLGTGQIPFESVLETAVALGAPTIRVWAGTVGSRDADSAVWREIVRDGQRSVELASAAGLSISLEFHPDTLTDTPQSTLKLLREIGHPNVFSYWQPPLDGTREANAQGLAEILPRLGNVHVFHWFPKYERHPLVAGAADWKAYLRIIRGNPKERFLMLEFVQDDEEQAFLQDAQVLRGWLSSYH